MPVKAGALARMVTGTHVPDAAEEVKCPVLRWAMKECRSGSLKYVVNSFVESQAEWLDPDLVLVERIDENQMICCIPCRMSDSESPHTFQTEVRFKLDPNTGETERMVG